MQNYPSLSAIIAIGKLKHQKFSINKNDDLMKQEEFKTGIVK